MGKRKAHYAARIGDQICEAIALGKTLKQALTTITLAPEIRTFWRWYDEFEDFRIKYDRARQMSADVHADDMLEMARDAINHPAKAAGYRVAADILKWQADVRDRKKYGSKVEHEIKEPPPAPEKVRSEITRLEKELGIAGSQKTSRAPASPAAAPHPKSEKPNFVGPGEPEPPALAARHEKPIAKDDVPRFHSAHDQFPAPKGLQ
jgi:hypothetical protein